MKQRALAIGGLASIVVWYASGRLRRKDKKPVQDVTVVVETTSPQKKVAVDKEFIKRLRYLLKIVIPGLRSKEFFILVLHSSFLVARTVASIYVAKLDGAIVRSIVSRSLPDFLRRLSLWLAIALPISYINSMIRFLESKLGLAFRTRLVNKVYGMYMENETYYRIQNLDGRLPNPDQCLTDDVGQFCSDLAHIYSHVSKPLLDIVLMTAQLAVLSRTAVKGAGNAKPLLVAGLVIGATGLILRLATPPFGRMVAEEARLYGELRAAHARVINRSEEIAFYRGHEVERSTLSRCYHALAKHTNRIFRRRITYTMLEQFLMKYVWSACGMVMIAIPTFQGPGDQQGDGQGSGEAVSGRTEDFITARGLLVSAADAIERLMSSWKDVTELAGRTARVYEMLHIFEDVKNGRYVRGLATGKAEKKVDEEAEEKKEGGMKRELSTTVLYRRANRKISTDTVGEVIECADFIKLEDVPIVTPTGDVLVDSPNLNLDIRPGMHLLITGPNGCGKSSLFRMIGGLWPIMGGKLYKPPKEAIFYVPQKPFLNQSTLREQFIYPHTVADMEARGLTDKDLKAIIEVVDMTDLVKHWGLDAKQDWALVFSGGEMQKVGFARVFYHKPKFAFLDECTSQVSVEVEGRMYSYAKGLGVTLMTVTHRPTLWKYHTHLLQYDGQRSWSFSRLDAETRETLREEKDRLEAQLGDLPRTQQRLKELCEFLGESSRFLPEVTVAESPRSA